jgi:hypothetical protein
MVEGSRGLRLPEGAIEVVVSETAAIDGRLLVALVEDVVELWDEVGWGEELYPLVEEDDTPCDVEVARDAELDTDDDKLGTEEVEDDNPCDEAVVWDEEPDMVDDVDDNTSEEAVAWGPELNKMDEDEDKPTEDATWEDEEDDWSCDKAACEDDTELVKDRDVEDELD